MNSQIVPTGPRFDDAQAIRPHLKTAGGFIRYYLMRHRTRFIGILGFVFGAAFCSVAVQYVMKLLVDRISGPRVLGEAILLTLVSFLILIASESAFWRLLGWLVCRTTVGIGVDLRLDLFHCLSGQSMRYFAENLAGSLGQRITATAGNFGALTNTVVWRTLPPFIDFLGAVVIFATIDSEMTVTLAAFVLAVTGGLIWFGERGRPLHRAYSEHAARNGGDLIDTISNMWTVKAFSARSREWHRHERHFQTEAAAQRKSWMYVEKTRVLHDLALWLMASSMLTWAIYLWSVERATPGDVVIVFTLTFRILHSSRDMALSLIDIAQQFGFIDETLAVIGETRVVYDLPHAPPLICRSGEISFRNVSFSYSHGRGAVRDISVSIPARQKVGIVGPSGAGKSTLVYLLQRLHDVDKGHIAIDGQVIAQVTQESLRSALAVVPQEISLLHRSVIENIRFARPDATDAEVHAAARAAACDGFVRLLPHGYDTIVGERGTKLSGGQRQRIGIARAFLKDSPIIILDEATSALDTEAELEIQKALVRLMSNRTVIAVAHRLSTLVAFDRILVLKDGRIVEDGSIAELRRQGGVFNEIWRRQVEGLACEELTDAA